MKVYLVRIECGSIQNYIFASNRLQEAIGGSYLVKQATEDYLEYFLGQTVGEDAVVLDWQKASHLGILHRDTIQAEILYSGGGNSLVLFKSKDDTTTFLNLLSGYLTAIAPGLVLLSGRADFESEEADSLRTAIRQAQEQLETLKEEGWAGIRLEGISINRSCSSTGLAAAFRYEEPYLPEPQYISPQAAAKRAASRKAQSDRQLKRLLAPAFPQHRSPFDLENIGGQEGDKHIAVVHTDGNELGKRLQSILDQNGQSTESLAAKIRAFSSSVNNAAEKAFTQLIRELVQSLDSLQERGLVLVGDYLPLRPLVFGGDDLTFVCEGKLGLPLAARYLELFARYREVDETGKETGKNFSACAGVVIAKNHFPLARAYNLADQLCDNAKKMLKEDYPNSSWLDFHVIYSGLTGNLEQIRAVNQNLYKRPWRVVSPEGLRDPQSWEIFRSHIRRFTERENPLPRSIVKGLRDALLAGKSATDDFINQMKLRNHTLYETDLVSLSGDDLYLLYDPIDLMDFYLDLNEAENTSLKPEAAHA